MNIIYLSFLWAVFSGLFFLDGTHWRAPNIFVASLHYIFGILILIYFVFKISKKEIELKLIQEKNFIIAFFLVCFFSTILNLSSVVVTLKFFITLIAPITLYIIIVYDRNISIKQIKKAFIFFVLICVIQFTIAILKNLNELTHGIIIIDDYFRGTMGAYQFVFLLNIYSIYLVNKFLSTKKLNIIEIILMICFLLSFVISGAGGYLLIFILSQVINILFITYYYSMRDKAKFLIPSFLIVLFFYFITNYFLSNYWLAETIIKKFLLFGDTYGIYNNPKVYITLSALKSLSNVTNFMIGLGPGQYLSGIGGNPSASYYGGILLDEEGSSAYAVNSDFFSIFSEVGILGLIIFYLLVYSAFALRYKHKPISEKAVLLRNTLRGVFIFAIILSLQYRIFIFFVTSYIFWFYAGILKRSLLNESINNKDS